MNKMLLAGAVALATISTAAMASVTFDYTSGTGFVGKGDVQLAFGWNNAAAQKNANAVTFAVNSLTSYEAVCTWTTGEGKKGEKIHNVEHKKSATVLSNVAFELKKTGQYTGYFLNGFGATTSSGDVPVVGGACQGNEGNDAVWSSVTVTGSSGGVLSVTYNGVSVELPNTPIITTTI